MRRFSRLPLWWQLIIGLFFFFFCSVIVTGVCLTMDMKEISKNNWSYLEGSNEQWKMEIDMITANVDRLRYLHLIDSRIEGYLKDKNEGKEASERILKENYMSSILRDIRGMNSYVLRITILTEQGDVYGNYVEDSPKQIQEAEAHMLYGKDGYKNEMSLTDIYEGEINLIPYELLTFSYPMYGISSEEKLGTIYIDLDFVAMEKIFSSLPQDEVAHFLVNENGIIYRSETSGDIELPDAVQLKEIAKTQDGKKQLRMGDRAFHLHVTKIDDLDWYLVSCMDSRSFMMRGMNGIYVLAVWIVVMFGFLLFGGIWMINRINRPIRDFSEVLGKVTLHEKQKPIHITAKENTSKEIREMIAGYNELVNRIEEHIILAYQKELSQKQAELKMLQYQINPHFLYNTLNIVSALARLNGVSQISEISESLSRIFHYNVKGGQLVKMKEELEYLQYYQRIQTIRFPEKFEVVYDIEERLDTYMTLKFLLQPLLENAIEHGVVPCKRKGRIEVQGRLLENKVIRIRFFDNGAGIPAEDLQRLREQLENAGQDEDEDAKKGIGILNVHRRIQNYYGKEYGVFLESEAGSYTSVSVMFPAQRQYEEEEVHGI